MKQFVSVFAAMLILVSGLCGCGTDIYSDGSSQPTPSTQGTQPQQTKPPFTMPEYTIPPVPTSPDVGYTQPAEPIIDQDIYILTGYNNSIYYIGDAGHLSYNFRVFSRKPLDVNSISVSVPIEHRYFVKVSELDLEGIALDEEGNVATQFSSQQFPYALYMAYQSIDFKELARLEWEMEQHRLALSEYENLLSSGQITYEEYKLLHKSYEDARNAYYAYRDSLVESYKALTKEDLPQFYVYYVSIQLDSTQKASGESFTEIEVTIGDQVFHQQVGKITLKDKLELPSGLDWYENGWNADDGIMGSGNAPLPYNEGVHLITNYFSFEADVFKSLKRVVLDNPEHKIDRVWVVVWPESGDRTIEEWNMEDPYEVYPGDRVFIHISYRDDYKEKLGYTTKVYGYLEYETDGKSFCKKSECYISNGLNLYVQYAMLFEGLDLSSYYRDYYYPLYESWRYDTEATPGDL